MAESRFSRDPNGAWRLMESPAATLCDSDLERTSKVFWHRATHVPMEPAEDTGSFGRLRAEGVKDFADAVKAVMTTVLTGHAEAKRQDEAKRLAFDTLQQIIGITTEVFGGLVAVKESFDPEHPDEKYVVFAPEVKGDNKEILALEALWRSKIIAAAPQWDRFRLSIKRVK